MDQQILKIGDNNLEFKFNSDKDKLRVKIEMFVTECGSRIAIPAPIADNNSFFEVFGIKEIVPGDILNEATIESPYVKIPDHIRKTLNQIEPSNGFDEWLEDYKMQIKLKESIFEKNKKSKTEKVTFEDIVHDNTLDLIDQKFQTFLDRKLEKV